MSRSSSAHLPLLLQLVVVFNELFSKTLVGGYESLRPARFLSSLAMLLLSMKILTSNACFWDLSLKLSHLIVSMACWIDICLLDIRNAITSVADRLQWTKEVIYAQLIFFFEMLVKLKFYQCRLQACIIASYRDTCLPNSLCAMDKNLPWKVRNNIFKTKEDKLAIDKTQVANVCHKTDLFFV